MQLDFSSLCPEKLKYIKTAIDKLFVCVMVVHKDTSGLPGAIHSSRLRLLILIRAHDQTLYVGLSTTSTQTVTFFFFFFHHDIISMTINHIFSANCQILIYADL